MVGRAMDPSMRPEPVPMRAARIASFLYGASGQSAVLLAKVEPSPDCVEWTPLQSMEGRPVKACSGRHKPAMSKFVLAMLPVK